MFIGAKNQNILMVKPFSESSNLATTAISTLYRQTMMYFSLVGENSRAKETCVNISKKIMKS